MASFVTCNYSVVNTGPSAASIGAAMAAPATLGGPGVPLPAATLIAMGLRVVSDTMIATTTRSVELGFGPSVAATVAAVMANNARLASVTVNTPGEDYILPPIVSFTGGGPAHANLDYADGTGHRYPSARAHMNVQAAAVQFAGTAYNAPTTTVTFIGGLPPALRLQPQESRSAATRVRDAYPAPNGPPFAVNSLSLSKPGSGYSSSSYLIFEGEVGPGGHQAQAVITSFGPNGQILGVLLTDPGANYLQPPSIAIVDPTPVVPPASVQKKLAAIVANMGAGTPATGTLTLNGGGSVTGVTILTPGSGYVQPPSMVIYDSSAAGSGAATTARMGIDKIVVDDTGRGLSTAPTVVLTPYFESLFPTGGGQAGPFFNFPLYEAIQQATLCQVVPAAPALS
jgi:hypothetical protein